MVFRSRGRIHFSGRIGHLPVKGGRLVICSRKMPHAFANVSDTGKLMIAYQPAGTIEQFFNDGSLVKNPTPAVMQDLFRAHAMEIVGPPIKLD